MIKSYNVQVGYDASDKAVCAILILDGILAARPSRTSEFSAALDQGTLHITVDDRNYALAHLDPEICALLQGGKPLVMKHTVTGVECSVTTS